MCHDSAVAADKDIRYRVAYDEAVRALSEQQIVIDSFRIRAGLLPSSTAITMSFLGAQFLDGGKAGLRRLALFFQVASGLLTLEVFLWIISLATP